MDACTPRGLDFWPHRQYGQRYSFVRRNAPDPPFAWDPDQLIEKAIRLSRLIIPNTHCTEYAVRCVQGPAPDTHRIVPLGPEVRFYAFRTQTEERDWLCQHDARALAGLLDRFLALEPELPERVRFALLLDEYAWRVQKFQVAIVHVVSALEALLKTDRHGATRQFTARVPALAADLNVDVVTSDLAERFYDARSASVHGRPVNIEFPSQESVDLTLVRSVLAKALRRTIEDSSFRQTFADTDAIRDRWPP